MKQVILTFCICTYNRNEGLIKLLKSINSSILPPNIDFADINFIVVGNYDGSSKSIIQKKNFRFNVVWYHEVSKGLTYARNRSVELATGA
jgi:glycosyltransferase involved in cell wall biosynthesis